eukprot:6586304-Ditylum_brightwellii.AAC.1
MDDPMKFWEFYDQLSFQICTYKPLDRLYTGDETMRVYVQYHRSRCEKRGRPKKDNMRNEIAMES